MMEVSNIKAEEILLKVMEAKKELQKNHKKPTKVIMHSEYYRRLKIYRAALGDYPTGMEDYLTQDKMIGLDICIDNNYGIEVTV